MGDLFLSPQQSLYASLQMYRPLSFVDRFFTERLEMSNVTFDSEVHIARVECPTLILHAQDDRIVPIFLTRKVYSNQGGRRASPGHYIIYADKKKLSYFHKLYEAGLKSRPPNWPPLQFIEFHKDLGCRHEHICRAPELPSIIR